MGILDAANIACDYVDYIFFFDGTVLLHVMQKRVIEGSSEKVHGALFKNKNNII
jgi:hypothetical protein